MMSQQMVGLNFPLHLLATTIFVVFIALPTSNGVDDMYEECSSSLMSCGKLQNVGYPFWGFGRPKDCGHPALQLQCRHNQSGEYPILQIDGDEVPYHVLSISKSDANITVQLRVVLPYYTNTTCPHVPIRTIFNESLERALFSLSPRAENFQLYYNCSRKSNITDDANSITYCSNQRNLTGYYLNNTSDSRKNKYYKSCKSMDIPVLKDGLNDLRKHEDLLFLLMEGFEVEYSKEYSSSCSACEHSGGLCGSAGSDFKCWKKPVNKKLILGIAIPGGLFFLLAMNAGFCYCMRLKFRSPTLLTRMISSDPLTSDLEDGCSFHGIPVFTYSELQEATNNFDATKELGDGGFGVVYFGKLRDGREVAVKRLYEKNYKRVGQFNTEVKILTHLRHQNLVTLYGCTSRNSRELLLVYEYIPNGTVADHLYGDRSGSGALTWAIRMKIAIGTASALSYLHNSDIIHRDVKTNNILLDNSFSVKVADFGLSRLFPCDVTHVSTAPQGTPGYLDPTYHKSYQVTDKSDVYSFGVVLVELISSLPAVDISRKEDEINLSDYALKRIQQGLLGDLVDQKLGFESDFKVKRMITLVAELAFQCLQQEKEVRPCMTDVLEALKQIADLDYEALEAEEIDQTTPPSKLTSVAAGNVIEPPPSSPSSVIDNWVMRSSTSNTSSSAHMYE